MQSLRPADLRAKSQELYAKVEDNREYSHPSKRTAGVSIGYLRQAITLMTLHVPKDQWLPEDYLRVMRCYQRAVSICIDACQDDVQVYRSSLVNAEINEVSLSNININHSVLLDFVRNADEFYHASAAENNDNIEFHFAACAALLHYHRKIAAGDLGLVPAEAGFAKELQAALLTMESRVLPLLDGKLKARQQTPLTPSQLRTLADCYRYISDLYLMNRQYDLALRFIMLMCEAINALPEPVNKCHPSKDDKSHDEFVFMHAAYTDFQNAFLADQHHERYTVMPVLINLARESLQWHTKLTPQDVSNVYEAVCNLDIKTSLLQRQFLRHIIKSLFDNSHCDVVRKNGVVRALQNEALVKEFSAMHTHLEKLEAVSPSHSPTLFRKGGGESKDQGSDDNTRVHKQAKR